MDEVAEGWWPAGEDEDDGVGREEDSLQTDVKSGDIQDPEVSVSNGGETITLIKNGASKTYWVWGRPKMNNVSLNILPEEPKTQKHTNK